MRIHLEVGVAPDWRPWAPGDATRAQGGTERAAHRLAAALAAAGHEVTARGGGAWGVIDGVTYVGPSGLAADALVCIMAEAPEDVVAPRSVAWSHAADWPRHGEWDAVVAASEWHAALLRGRLGRAVEVIPIPLAPTSPSYAAGVARDRFLYASSPDRGLHRLLAIWPALWEAFRTPLAITYDLRAVLRRHGRRADVLGARLRDIAGLLNQPGVIVHGSLDDAELVALRARSRAVLYPLDPVSPASELYSLSLLESCAAGVPLVLSPTDALGSEYRDAARFVDGFEPKGWVRAVREVLDDPRWCDRALAHAASRWDAGWGARWAELLGRPASRPAPRRSQRWLVAAIGVGHGEAALAREVVDTARARGHEVRVVVNDARHLRVVGEAAVASSAADCIELLGGADRIVLATSMTGLPILAALRRAAVKIPIVALDAAWPEWLSDRPSDPLPDLIVSTLSRTLFEAGLTGEPPLFRLPPEVVRRVRCVGPLPPMRHDEKAPEVLVYLGQGVGGAVRLLPALATALDEIAIARGLRVTAVGCPELGGREIRHVPSLPPSVFADAVARARVVVCHPGAGTLGQARAAGTRVLCLTQGRALGVEPHAIGEREAQARFEAGWVEHLAGALPAGRYRETIEALLEATEPLREGGGAEHAVAVIEAAARALPRLDALPGGVGALVWRPPELRP